MNGRPLYNTAFYAANHVAKTVRGPYHKYDDALDSRRVDEVIVSKAFARLLMDSGYKKLGTLPEGEAA